MITCGDRRNREILNAGRHDFEFFQARREVDMGKWEGEIWIRQERNGNSAWASSPGRLPRSSVSRSLQSST
jgi:hypothetical protein